jgi:transposase-like protein
MAQLSYRRHRFPPEIIQHAIWLYLRFTLSYRDVEELLLGREGEGTRDYRHLTNTVPASSGKAASSFTP